MLRAVLDCFHQETNDIVKTYTEKLMALYISSKPRSGTDHPYLAAPLSLLQLMFDEFASLDGFIYIGIEFPLL